MHNKSSFRLSLALLLLLVAETLANDEDTDFLMNVFSDLGPVLALFGEQFARQFLSETFTWYDHIIFACVPLGIMTAIAGAIRVEGRGVLRAFIGRARENRAAAEIDFMSSTSAEVGELFNGKGIVRTMGRSDIAQFIVFPDRFLETDEKASSENQTGTEEPQQHSPDSPDREEPEQTKERKEAQSWGIHTLKSVQGKGILSKEDYRDDLDVALLKWLKPFELPAKSRVMEPENGGDSNTSSGAQGQNDDHEYWSSLQYPNLQLNIASKKISSKQRSIELQLAAVAAVILQVSLLAIAVVIPYRVDGYGQQQPWGLPCYIIGSVLLSIGMLCCSVAIERSTEEFKWNPSNSSNNSEPSKQQVNLYWVQRKQRVSDQDFGSYIIYAQEKEFFSTSSRREDVSSNKNQDHGGNVQSHRQNSAKSEAISNMTQKQNSSGVTDEDLP